MDNDNIQAKTTVGIAENLKSVRVQIRNENSQKFAGWTDLHDKMGNPINGVCGNAENPGGCPVTLDMNAMGIYDSGSDVWLEGTYELRVKSFCLAEDQAAPEIREYAMEDEEDGAIVRFIVDLTPPIMKAVTPMDHDLSRYMFTPAIEYQELLECDYAEYTLVREDCQGKNGVEIDITEAGIEFNCRLEFIDVVGLPVKAKDKYQYRIIIANVMDGQGNVAPPHDMVFTVGCGASVIESWMPQKTSSDKQEDAFDVQSAKLGDDKQMRVQQEAPAAPPASFQQHNDNNNNMLSATQQQHVLLGSSVKQQEERVDDIRGLLVDLLRSPNVVASAMLLVAVVIAAAVWGPRALNKNHGATARQPLIGSTNQNSNNYGAVSKDDAMRIL